MLPTVVSRVVVKASAIARRDGQGHDAPNASKPVRGGSHPLGILLVPLAVFFWCRELVNVRDCGLGDVAVGAPHAIVCGLVRAPEVGGGFGQRTVHHAHQLGDALLEGRFARHARG